MQKTIILIPIYNDWKSVSKLLENIDMLIGHWDAEVSVVIINDASTEDKSNINVAFRNLKSIKLINMKENKGHARCIAAGLKYIFENEEFDFVIPMDGDGEDRPVEIGAMLCEAYGRPDLPITANRIKRSENFFFKFCYTTHKLVTLIFTGHSIKFGNYCCLPKQVVLKLIKEKATWSSFSGSLTKVTKFRGSVESTRGIRYFGPSKMSFINLIKHSLAIIGVFKFNVLIRSILFLAVYMFIIQLNVTAITLIPVALIISLVFSVFIISDRESLNQINNSLSNILNIDKLEM
tara:strand:+ start:274 stop:1149 length:876 start_codon:yes stop_codon:yes gene_type:complete